MIDYSKSSKGPFNFRANPDSEKPPASLDESQTDKDNADKRYDPPNQQQHPAPNLAAFGAVGNKGNRAEKEEPEEVMIIEFTPDVAGDNDQFDLPKDGDLIVATSAEGMKYTIKQDDKISTMNLNGGRISMLKLEEEDTCLAHYRDGEWKDEPKTFEVDQVVSFLETKYGAPDTDKFHSFSELNPDIDKDYDR